MPHFTLHYSTNLEDFHADHCLGAVNAALANSGHFDELDIKSRAYPADQFQVGVDGTGRGFVAGTLSVLTGRSAETRREMGEAVLKALASCVQPTPAQHVQVSVEVLEIERATYAKCVVAG